MKVDPVHAPVGDFFGREPMFRVPKYQRSYAWENLEIEDFLKDLTECFEKRKAGNPVNHFFGGIVSVEKTVAGVVKQHEYELVDGQQRFATFILLMASIIAFYKELLVQAEENGDDANKNIIESRISKLSERFIEFEQEVNRVTETVDVLNLSKADDQFFKDLIRESEPEPDRESHERLQYAYNEVKEQLRDLAQGPNLTDYLDDLEIIQQIIDDDFSLIHIITYDHKEAYKLFQVLNDRGKSLTEGDLLRAKTLELLEGFNAQQNSVESLWNDILKDPPKNTDNFLKWIFASYTGDRAGSNTLFDDFLNEFYPEHQNPLTNVNADSILSTTRTLQKEIRYARLLIDGSWPFTPSARPITAWDRNRLSLLIRELGLTVTMPLLLASIKLGERTFSKVVQMLELFLFRYKIIANQHIGAVIKVIHSESKAIRDDTANYNIATLRTKLNMIQTDRANDQLFRNTIDNLNYKSGGGNKPIKYFLMTLEHYKRWYDAGAAGNPICQDKTRVYDFTDTTIEHVYPRNAQGAVVDATLEPLKNNIGNLTFMGPADNVAGDNDDYPTKRPIFQASSVSLNNDIGHYAQWTATELQQRERDLKDMACSVFTV